MPVCYQKGKERGLWFEIKCLEDLINSPTAPIEEKKYAKKLLKSYKQYSEEAYKRID